MAEIFHSFSRCYCKNIICPINFISVANKFSFWSKDGETRGESSFNAKKLDFSAQKLSDLTRFPSSRIIIRIWFRHEALKFMHLPTTPTTLVSHKHKSMQGIYVHRRGQVRWVLALAPFRATDCLSNYHKINKTSKLHDKQYPIMMIEAPKLPSRP
jgi:hypothetical protein